jgi:hypothetical protein
MVKFYYSNGDEVKVGDIIKVWNGSSWNERFVEEILKPGTQEAKDYPNGGVVIADRNYGWVVETPDSGTLNEKYELSRRKNDKFYYISGDEVKVGDIIKVWNGSNWVDGVVDEIMQPGTQLSKHFDCPKGGIFIKDPHHGMVLEHPDSGILDEDFELASRKKKRK